MFGPLRLLGISLLALAPCTTSSTIRAALPAPPLDVPPALAAEIGDHGWLAPREWRDVCERTQLAGAARLAATVSDTRRPLTS